MRTETIAKMVKAGVGQDRAEKFYALFLSAMCGGIEPEAGDVFSREDIAAAFPGNVPARNALTAALCVEQKEAPKPATLKEKHRATLDTAILLAEMLKGGALWVTEELLDRATRRNAGLSSPCLFLKDGGGVYEAESAQWIEWIRKGVPLGDGMDIDGKFRKPVRIGEERPAEKFTRDPFGSGPLTMPGMMSVCGASLEGVAEDAVSFLVLVCQHEQLSPAEQRKACALAKGGLAGLFAEYPLAKRKWDGGSRPEPTVGPEQSRNPPPAGGDVAVSVGRTPPVGPARLDLNTIHRALVDSGLTSSRDALLAGIPRAFVSSLTTVPSAAAQALIDLGALQNAGMLRDGSRPLVTYLQAAVALAGPRREAQVFRDALRALENSSPAWLFREWRS